ATSAATSLGGGIACPSPLPASLTPGGPGMIVFLRLKCHCRGCKRYCRVDAHGLCPACHEAEFIREEMAGCLVGAVLAPVAWALFGLVMAFCTGAFSHGLKSDPLQRQSTSPAGDDNSIPVQPPPYHR